jgi:uncharacterized protein
MLIRTFRPTLGIILAALFLCFAAPTAVPQEPALWSQNTSPLPAPTGMVNDFAGVIDQATMEQLEKRLRKFRDETDPPIELAVAVVRTTGDRPIFDYSLAVARGWGIGAKQDDNPSALLFIAIDDRKYFTQISKDLEDELPDGLAGSLQRQYLVPEFRRGNYSKGIVDTIDAYIRTIETRSSGGVATPPFVGSDEPRSGDVSDASYSTFCCLAVILIVVLIILSNRGGRSGGGPSGWGGGGFGGSGGALPWIIGSVIANAASSSSSSSDWGSGGSSDWGSSGGSDWGGFGGGGDFGGGGAGGDW